MEILESINYLNLYALPELCNKNFFIPDYQRGYRWGETQIYQLLEDLYTFFYNMDAAGNFYCLQPIVVKKMNSSDIDKYRLDSTFDDYIWYEVIDGQQRLTTIRIILALETLLDEDKDKLFNICYQTRPLLGELFENLIKTKDENKKYTIHTESDARLDIDSWHILQAANLIIKWFQNDEQGNLPSISEFKGSFYEKFTNGKDKNKSVQVIWYELRDDSDPYEMFKRLNDKSISLNNAELIRALFLSDSAKYKCEDSLLNDFNEDIKPIVEKREQARKQSHIIEKWDIIESKLRNHRFWAFIKDDNSTEQYSCRIEYIFDLISKKDTKEKDPLFTYLKFERSLRTNEVRDLWSLWLKVETYFSILQAWFDDRYYYHKLGFLITELGASVLMELLAESSTSSKTVFKSIIDKKIKSVISDKRNPQRNIWAYSYDSDYDLLRKTLFLYNVESTLQRVCMDYFPFEEYKKVDWTLEHIHAQNSERLDQSDKSKWLEWLEENLKVLGRLQSRLVNDRQLSNLVSVLDDAKNVLNTSQKDKYTFARIVVLFDMVQAYFDQMAQEEGKPTEIHDISNMALLSGNINSSIGNSVFEVKRQKIMDEDAKGAYIPYCTRKVFLKYYNCKDENFMVQQNFYWSEKDRRNYLNDIKNILRVFIDTPCVAETVVIDGQNSLAMEKRTEECNE